MSVAAYQKIEGRQSALALDMNECLVPLPEEARRAFDDLDSGKAFAYPEYGELNAAICAKYGLPAAAFRPTAGADEGISVTVQAFLGPGKRITVPDPVFSMYEVRGSACGAAFTRVALKDDWSLDPDEFIAAAKGADLAVLVSPGNPAGKAISSDTVDRIAKAISPAPLVIDEAYADFPGISFLGRLPGVPNAIVLRSLSKSFGIAGLRVGFLAANGPLMARMDPFVLPYGISRPSAKAALSLLRTPGMPEKVVSEVLRCRAAAAELLRGYFPRVDESDANFVLANVGPNAVALRDAMARNGVLVKAWDSGRMAGWMRLTAFPVDWRPSVEAALEKSLKEVRI